MRSLREWVAEAPTAVLAAALATVVIGAGLFGFAVAELTSDEGGGGSGIAEQAPAVVGGSIQDSGIQVWPKGLSAHTVVLASFRDRAAATAAARDARSHGLDAGLLRAGRGWAVYSGHYTSAAGAKHAASELTRRYPNAHHRFVQSSQ